MIVWVVRNIHKNLFVGNQSLCELVVIEIVKVILFMVSSIEVLGVVIDSSRFIVDFGFIRRIWNTLKDLLVKLVI